MAILSHEAIPTDFQYRGRGRRAGNFFETPRPGRKVVKSLALSAMTLMAFIAISARPSHSQVPTEYQVKAAFLYNFGKFIDWPPKAFHNPNSLFTLCVLGEDPFGADLERTVSGKTINARELAVRRLKGAQGLESCHILFVSSSEAFQLPQILRALRSSSILTVGETEGFAHLGGIINFSMEEDKVRFEINVDSAERAGLKISSRLLKLAKIVRDGGKN